MDCKIIFGFILGIIGTSIGAYISHLFSENRRIKEEFNNAAVDFRAAFIEEQRLLDTNSLADRASAGSASSIIKNAINKHETAMIRFKPFICKAEISAYEEAWHNYAGNSQHFEQYTGDNVIKKEERRKLALANIEKLLEFAKHK